MNMRYDWPPIERYECKADSSARLAPDPYNMFSCGRNE